MLRSLTKFAPAAAAGAGFVAGSATLFTVEAKSVDVEAVKRDVFEWCHMCGYLCTTEQCLYARVGRRAVDWSQGTQRPARTWEGRETAESCARLTSADHALLPLTC